MKDNAILSALASEIERLEVSLKATKLEYTQLKNSLAAITILPNELLASIFEAGCNTHDTWAIPLPTLHSARSKLLGTQDPLQEPPFEILVSHITRHWRNVAHTTPSLWTRITLDTRTQHFLDIGADYITRSGALPLDLRIDMTYIRGLPPPIKTICHLISPEMRRWGQLRVKSDWYPGLQYMLESMPGHAPILECMDLCYENPNVLPPDDPEHPEMVLTGRVSCLTHMVLKGVTLRCHLPPLAALTSLECHCMQLNSAHHMVHDLFENLTQLTRLVLNDVDFDWANVDGIELPALVALYLRNIPDYDQVLSVISAPSLQTLYLNTVDSNEMLNFPNALALESGQTKFPHLRTFFIKPVQYEPFFVSPESWRALALITPTVTHFGLLHDEVDKFLQAFAYTTASDTTSSIATSLPIAWPELHTLSLPEGSHTNLLDDILSARVTSHCPIRKLQISDSIKAWLGGGLEAWRGILDIVECDETVKKELYPVLWRGEVRDGDSWVDDGNAISDFTDTSSVGSS